MTTRLLPEPTLWKDLLSSKQVYLVNLPRCDDHVQHLMNGTDYNGLDKRGLVHALGAHRAIGKHLDIQKTGSKGIILHQLRDCTGYPDAFAVQLPSFEVEHSMNEGDDLSAEEMKQRRFQNASMVVAQTFSDTWGGRPEQYLSHAYQLVQAFRTFRL